VLARSRQDSLHLYNDPARKRPNTWHQLGSVKGKKEKEHVLVKAQHMSEFPTMFLGE
jgi:hypothetical protein